MRIIAGLLMTMIAGLLLIGLPEAQGEGVFIITTTPKPPAVDCRGAVDGMEALIGDLVTPDYFIDEAMSGNEVAKTGTEFDVMEYFTVLDHLSMQEGYVLDYVYRGDSMGGLPVLYARLEDQEPYSVFSEFAEAQGESTTSYLDSVEFDGTPDGYFQFVILDVMASQFYLFWHANYNDYQIVCDAEDVEAIIADAGDGDMGLPMSEEAQEAARQLQVEPVVTWTPDVAQVEVVLFTRWGGFARWTFTISREFPHTIQDITSETLVEYDCGIMF